VNVGLLLSHVNNFHSFTWKWILNTSRDFRYRKWSQTWIWCCVGGTQRDKRWSSVSCVCM